MEKTWWQEQSESQRGEEKRSGRQFVLPRSAKSVQNGAGFREKSEHTGPAEKDRVASVPQREQFTSTPEPPLPKEK